MERNRWENIRTAEAAIEQLTVGGYDNHKTVTHNPVDDKVYVAWVDEHGHHHTSTYKVVRDTYETFHSPVEDDFVTVHRPYRFVLFEYWNSRGYYAQYDAESDIVKEVVA